MDKIFIKPTAKEIILRGKPEDGQTDVFSYNYDSADANGLGSLFIIGHVQPTTEDTSYMINLVSSLAKREYYARPNAFPRDSFSKTLKKINEVLQDFFHDKNAKINIGIFAIAGENIFISRLGKFKIILARDSENIDILNNINLFSKEHIQEKEFSNIISGKVAPRDKIFAFYPGRSIIAREKNIKADLIKMGVDEFSEKLNAIRKDNENFLCAGIHISIDKHSEPAIIISPQPQELRKQPEVILAAKTAKASKEKPAITVQELPNVRPITEVTKPAAKTEQPPVIKTKPTPSVESKPEEDDLTKSNVYYPGSQSLSMEQSLQSKPTQLNPSPIIRPSEFSSAKKENFFSIILKKYKPSGVYIIGQQPFMNKSKLILAGSLVAVLIVGGVLAKLTFAPSLPIPGISNEEEKAANALLKQIQSQLELAKGYKDQNNIFEARRTLLDSLGSITTASADDEDVQSVKREVSSLLDEIDKAVDLSPTLLYQISPDSGKGSLLTSTKNKLLVYSSNPNEADSGFFLTATETGVEKVVKIAGFNPFYLVGGEKLAVMLSRAGNQIGSLVLKDGGFKTSPLTVSNSIINAYPYQDNLYMLASDGIYKIVDAVNGKTVAVNWLNKDVLLPPQPALITVDSKIYVITQNGYLAAYYKGDKQSEVNTSIPVSPEDAFMTTSGLTSLYLIDKKMGRIYVLNKSSGSLEKTIKLNNEQPLISASISDAGAVYLLTSDNKVWKIVP